MNAKKRRMRTLTYAHSHSNHETRTYYVERQEGDTPLDTLARGQNLAAWLVGKGYDAHAGRFFEIAILKVSREKK